MGGMHATKEGLGGWPHHNFFLSKIFFLLLLFDSEGLLKKGLPAGFVNRHKGILAGL